jgi:hypothetical protein
MSIISGENLLSTNIAVGSPGRNFTRTNIIERIQKITNTKEMSRMRMYFLKPVIYFPQKFEEPSGVSPEVPPASISSTSGQHL